ncbi:MAG: hypothetical protein WAM28_02960, partial [Chlamydiales bacterium]
RSIYHIGKAASRNTALLNRAQKTTSLALKKPFRQSGIHAGEEVSKKATLNRFHQSASQLSESGKNNIRILRNWAKSKGWTKYSQPGKPESWGVFNQNRNAYDWRLKIKPEGSSRSGLHHGSKIPRFDARLYDGEYINPFTEQHGGVEIGTHIPLDFLFR